MANEFALEGRFQIRLDETALPVDDAVRGACEILGLDPLYLANEGKLAALVAREDADAVLAAMRAHPLGRRAAIVGEVLAGGHPGLVTLRSASAANVSSTCCRANSCPASAEKHDVHELGITRNLVAIVSDAAQGRRVRKVWLEIGERSALLPDAVRFCFDVVSKGTALEGATLEVVALPGDELNIKAMEVESCA